MRTERHKIKQNEANSFRKSEELENFVFILRRADAKKGNIFQGIQKNLFAPTGSVGWSKLL